MLLKAKLNLFSGMIVGATAIMVMSQLCKRKSFRKSKKAHSPASPPD